MKNPFVTVTFSCDRETAESFYKEVAELDLNKSETLRTLVKLFWPAIKANPNLVKHNDPKNDGQ